MGVDIIAALTETSTRLADELETKLDADVIAIIGNLMPGIEYMTRVAVEKTAAKRARLAVVLSTGGGIVEIVERMVLTLRHHYNEVSFIIPDVAMSAGTVFALSGDKIMMSYFSCLGPVDPQIEREGKLVPALSYLVQYDRLVAKSAQGQMTTAEFAMLQKFDMAELHNFEQARALTVSLLMKWLASYKFKNWTVTETRQAVVTPQMREARAKEVAEKLNDQNSWFTHGRPIPMKTVQEVLKIKIDDYETDPDLAAKISAYFGFLLSLMVDKNLPRLVHTKNYL